MAGAEAEVTIDPAQFARQEVDQDTEHDLGSTPRCGQCRQTPDTLGLRAMASVEVPETTLCRTPCTGSTLVQPSQAAGSRRPPDQSRATPAGETALMTSSLRFRKCPVPVEQRCKLAEPFVALHAHTSRPAGRSLQSFIASRLRNHSHYLL